MDRKYPAKMFLFCVITNFLFHYFYLVLLGIILCVVGIWIDICLFIGLAVFGLDLVLSVYDQIQIRNASLTESDNPEFNELMDAMYGSNSPKSFMKIIESRMQSADTIEFDEEPAEKEQPDRKA